MHCARNSEILGVWQNPGSSQNKDGGNKNETIHVREKAETESNDQGQEEHLRESKNLFSYVITALMYKINGTACQTLDFYSILSKLGSI